MKSKDKGKQLLITGGLGYVGGRIADGLLRRYPNLAITLSSSRHPIPRPGWAEACRLVHLDVRDPGSIHTAIEGMDWIIHLAALNEVDSMENIEAAWTINTRGTYELLSQAHEKGISRFIYFSTFHVYDQTRNGPITENSPTRPFHPYASTHRAAEDIVEYYRHYKEMKTLVFRLSNGYGYPMDTEINRWTLVFNDLCRQAVTSQKIILKSSGKQHRDFISLSDIVRATSYFLFDRPNEWEDGLYNLGGECSLSILGVAEKIAGVYAKKYGKTLQIEVGGNSGPIDERPVEFSIEKLKRTGFQLSGNMESEIERTLTACELFLNG